MPIPSPSPQTAQAIVASLMSIVLVVGVLYYCYKGRKIPQRTVIEAALVALALVALVIQSAVAPVRMGFRGWRGPLSLSRKTSEEGFSGSSQSTERGVATTFTQETLNDMPPGLQVYVTSLSLSSYTNAEMSKTIWTNIAPPPAKTNKCTLAANSDFSFATTPSFAVPGGFVMNNNVVTGPPSMYLGIDGNLSFSVAFVFQPSGAIVSGQAFSAYQLFANTSTGNGLSLQFSPAATGASGASTTVISTTNSSSSSSSSSYTPSTISTTTTTSATSAGGSLGNYLPFTVTLTIGDAAPIASTNAIVLNPANNYLVVTTKNNVSGLTVAIGDLSANKISWTPVIVVAPTVYSSTLVRSPAAAPPAPPTTTQTPPPGTCPSCPPPTVVVAPRTTPQTLVFSNVNMKINGAANWPANLVAFGVFDYALGQSDIGDLWEHYKSILAQYDPQAQALAKAKTALEQAVSCPYDAATCSACGGITDWSAASDSLFSGGSSSAACLSSINSYCTANPTASRCSCWNKSNPSYSGSCVKIRSAYSGAPLPKSSSTCPTSSSPPPPPPPPPPTPPPPPPPTSHHHHQHQHQHHQHSEYSELLEHPPFMLSPRFDHDDGHSCHHKIPHKVTQCPPTPPPPQQCQHVPKHNHGKCPVANDDDNDNHSSDTGFWGWLWGN